jgi:hypothetical protein
MTASLSRLCIVRRFAPTFFPSALTCYSFVYIFVLAFGGIKDIEILWSLTFIEDTAIGQSNYFQLLWLTTLRTFLAIEN